MASDDIKYYISPIVGLFGQVNYEEITKHDYEQFIEAKNIILAALHFEESFEIIISNHIDYETYIFKDSLQKSMQNYNKQHLANIRTEANRYISNTLGSIYNYLQYGNKTIKTITKNDFFKKTKDEYSNTYKVFPFINELRNYTQHYGFAAPSFEIFKGVKEVDGNQHIETKIKPSITLSSLKNDSDFYDYYIKNGRKNTKSDKIRKDSINNILEETDSDKLDITTLFRSFLDLLWDMHKQVREKVKAKIDSQEEYLQVKGKEVLNKDSLGYFDGYQVYKSINDTNHSTVIPVRVIQEYNFIIKKYNFIRLSKMVP